MEGGLSHPRRPLRTDGYVLRTDQLPCHLPDDDEHDLPSRNRPRLALRIYGRPSHPHEAKTGRNRGAALAKAPKISSSRPRPPRETRSLPQTREMLLRTRRNRLSLGRNRKRQISDGSAKTEWHRRLAR